MASRISDQCDFKKKTVTPSLEPAISHSGISLSTTTLSWARISVFYRFPLPGLVYRIHSSRIQISFVMVEPSSYLYDILWSAERSKEGRRHLGGDATPLVVSLILLI